MKFEKALERLEEIVASLEGGDMELEKSLEIFDEGVEMTKICQTHLSEAEKKIEKLVKNQNEELSTKPLEEERENGAPPPAFDDDVPF